MKTPVTMRLDDELVARAKAEAGRRKMTLTELVEEALRDEFARIEAAPSEPYVIPVFHPEVPGYHPWIPADLKPSDILKMMDDEYDFKKIHGHEEAESA